MAKRKPRKPPATSAEVAKAESVSTRTVRYWVRLGCPHSKKGARLRFSLKKVRAWRVKTGKHGKGSGPTNRANGVPAASMGRPRGSVAVAPGQGDGKAEDDEGTGEAFDTLAKMRAAKLKQAQLEVEKRERVEATANGELLTRVEVERRWLERVQLVGAGLLALPAKVSARLANKKARAVERILGTAVRDLLTAFSEEWPE